MSQPKFLAGQRVYVIDSGQCSAPPTNTCAQAVVDACIGYTFEVIEYIAGWSGPPGFVYWITQQIGGKPYRYAVHELELIGRCN